MSNCLNIIGLSFDIAGVVLLWFFTPTTHYYPSEKDAKYGIDQPTPPQKYKEIRTNYRIGLFFIIVGFALQIAAIFIV